MKTSEAIDQISAALAMAQGKIKNPEKNRTAKIKMKSGESYSFNYADLPSTFEAVQAAFAENKLSHSTSLVREPDGLALVTRICHASGQWYQSEVNLPHSEDVKVLAANITYLTRYLFTALAGIAADEDLDGEPEGQGSTYSDRKPATAPVKPAVSPVKPAVTPPGRAASPQPATGIAREKAPTRAEVGVAINKLSQAMKIDPATLKGWIFEVFAKDQLDLTLEEMQKFLGILQAEEAGMKV